MDQAPGGGAAEKPDLGEHEESVRWHSLPCELFEEFIHSYGLDVMIYLTMFDIELAVAAIRMKTPIGF